MQKQQRAAAGAAGRPDQSGDYVVATGVTYSISDLAKEFDLTTRAIRFYEDMGLLQPQRTGEGRRVRPSRPMAHPSRALGFRGADHDAADRPSAWLCTSRPPSWKP